MGFHADLVDDLEEHLVGTSTYTPSTMYLALLASGSTELSGGGYLRQAITFKKPETVDVDRVVVRNASKIQFPSPTANWGVVAEFGVFDALTGGKGLFSGEFEESIQVDNGDDPLVIEPSRLELSMDPDIWSQEVKMKVMELAFSGGTYQPSDLYAVLLDEEPGANDNGDSISEITGGGYSRFQIGTGSNNWTDPESGPPSNKNKLTFGPATENWGQSVKGVGLVDAASGGVLIGGTSAGPASVLDGDTVEINVEGLTLILSAI